MAKKVVVVGGGVGGLATAALLAQKGYQVKLIERNDSLGGRARVWEKDGFRFDMGPSWYLMPEVFERFFGLFGKKVSDFYQLNRLDPNYRIFFADQMPVEVPTNVDDACALFDTFEPNGGEKLRGYLQESKRRYESAMKHFVYRNYDTWQGVANPSLIWQGMRLRVFGSMGEYVQRTFVSDQARKIVQYPIVFLGGDPANTPALYSMMSHIDFGLGVWYPQGGMGVVMDAMVSLGKSLGVEYSTGVEVMQYLTKDQKVVGAKTSKGERKADVVVTNADYWHSEMVMQKSEHRAYDQKYWKSRVVAPSALILYLGLNKKLKNLKHHNLVFAHDWQAHFREIFASPKWSEKPSYYVCCPSQTDDSVAPEGGENLFVLVPLASGLEDSDAQRESYSQMVLAHLEQVMGENIADAIVVKRIYSHRDFAADYHALAGSALGLSHTLWQSVFWRPKMKHPKLTNLYHVGQYTHPGIGVPMCVIGAQNLVDRYF